MAETSRRARWRIGHLVVAVAASAFVLALLKFPQEYALPMVAVAGFLVIGACVVAAIINATSDRRSNRPGQSRSTPGGWMVAAAPVAVLMGLGFTELERHPFAVLPALLVVATMLLILFTWLTASDKPGPAFWRLAMKNLGVTLVVIVASLVVAAWMTDFRG
jgi:cobalamin synthase